MPTFAYKDANGKRVPSVTTIIGRFKDSSQLLYWANKEGLDGKTLDEARRPAASAGTMAHSMVECHLNQRPIPRFEGDDPAIVEKAKAAFSAYLSWQKMTNLEIRHTEVPLVSNQHKFGGCLDAIGIVRNMSNGLALCDWKSSNAVYADHLFQLAAYAILWDENYPDHPITGGFHLCRFAKEEGDYSHNYYPCLDSEKETFLIMRDLYDRCAKTKKRVG